MLDKSSEECLNGILNLLETMIEDSDKKKELERKDDDTIVSLLKGIVDVAKEEDAGTPAGELLEKLAKGLDAMKEIDNSVIDNIATSIDTINGVLNKMSIKDDISSNIDAFIDALNKLGTIDVSAGENLTKFINSISLTDNDQSIKNTEAVIGIIKSLNYITQTDIGQILKNLEKLDPSIGNKISELINNIKISNSDDAVKNTSAVIAIGRALNYLMETDIKAVLKNLEKLDPNIAVKLADFINNIKLNNINDSIDSTKAIIAVAKALNIVSETDIKQLIKNINKLDDKIPKKLASFIDSFMKEIKKVNPSPDDIKDTLKPISDLFTGLQAIVSSNVFSLSISLNPIKGFLLGRLIGQFVRLIIKAVDGMKIDESMKYLGSLLSPIIELAKEDSKISIYRVKKVLNKKTGKKIGEFFTALLDGMPEKKESAEAASAIAGLLKPLFGISLFGMVKFMLVTKVLSKERAESLNEFFTELTKGDWDEKKVEHIGKFISEFNKSLILIGVLLIGIVTLVALAPLVDVLIGAALVFFTIWFMKKTVIDLTNEIGEKDVESAANMIKSLGYTLLLIGTTISILAIVTAVFGFIPVVTGVAIMALAIYGIKYLVKELSESDISEETVNAMKATRDIGMFLLMVAGAIGIIAILTKVIGLPVVLTGFVIVGAFMLGSIYVIKSLAEVDGETLDAASKALVRIAATFAIVALVCAFLLAPIAKLIGPVLLGGAVVVGVIALGILAVRKLSEIKAESIDSATKALMYIAGVFTVISLVAAFILPKIGENFMEAATGAVVSLLIVTAMIGLVYLVNKLDEKETSLSIKTMAYLVVILTVVSLITLFVLKPIGEDAGEAALGAVIVVAITGLLILGVKLLSMIDGKSAQSALIVTAVLTVIFLTVALITKLVLIPIGAEAGDAALGALIVVTITALLILGVKLLSMIKGKTALWALAVTAIMAIIFLGIALITKEILIPIGAHVKDAALGTLLTVAIIAVLLACTYALSKIDGKKALKAVAVTAVIAFILLGVSLITKEILIPIGEKWEEAVIGASTVVGIIAAFGIIMFAVGELVRSKKILQALVRGGIVLAGIAGVLMLIGWMLDPFIDLVNKIAQSPGDVVVGAGIVALLLGAIGAVMFVVGELAKSGEVALAIAIGGAVLAGIGLVLFAVGELLNPFIDLAIKVGKDADNILTGSGIIALLVGATGAVMFAVGLLLSGPQAEFIAIGIAGGVAIIGGIALVMWEIKSLVEDVVSIVKSLNSVSESQISKAEDKVDTVFDLIFATVKKAAPNPIQMGYALAALAFAVPVLGVFKFLDYAVDAILKIINKINPKMFLEFTDIVIGNADTSPDKPDIHSLVGSLMYIVNVISHIDGIGKAMIISYCLRPIIDTISKYIDVIMKVATGVYIVGYDEKGNPKYRKMPASAFKDAAIAVTDGFTYFLKSLNEGFGSLDAFAVSAMAWMSKKLQPVIDLVSRFVDVIMKVATGVYIVGYDDNGKPKFKHLKASEFYDAGVAVSDSFAYFLNALNEGFSKLSVLSTYCMKWMVENLRPVLSFVGDFVDLVMKVATGTYVTGYDEKEHPIYAHFSALDFYDSGVAICDSFKYFLLSLTDGFKDLGVLSTFFMGLMAENLTPVLDTVSEFVDIVMTVAKGNRIVGYDRNGKPKYEKVTIDEFYEGGIAVTSLFKEFLQALTNGCKDLNIMGIFALDMLADSIGPVMEGIGSFVDSILKLATGVYISEYKTTKDGKAVPVYKRVTEDEYIMAAITIVKTFALFIDELTKQFDLDNHDGWFGRLLGNDKVSRTKRFLKALGESLGPVMEGVGKYVECILKLATGTYEAGKDDKGNPIIKHITPKEIQSAAEAIALQFVTFIDTLIKKVGQDDFKKKAESASEAITGSIGPIMEAVKSFSDALQPFIQLTDKESDPNLKSDYAVLKPGWIKDIATNLADAFVDFITIVSNHLADPDNAERYKSIIETSENVNEALTAIASSVSSLADIIKDLTDGDSNVINSGSTAITTFTEVFDQLVTYFSTNESKFTNIITTIEAAKTFVENAAEVISPYTDSIKMLLDLHSDNNKQEAAVDMLGINIEKIIKDFMYISTESTDIDFALVNRLMSCYTDVIDQIGEASNIKIRESNLTSCITTFLDNVKQLTAPEVSTSMESTGASIKVYVSRLKTFSTQIVATTKVVKMYTTELNKAKKALAALDAEIIGKEKKRSAALEKFAEQINNIAYAIDNMRDAFEALDENSILSMFSGVKELVEAATGVSLDGNSNNNQDPNNPQANQNLSARPTPSTRRTMQQGQQGQPGLNVGSRRGFQLQQQQFPLSGNVTFEFKDTYLQGFYRMR